MYYVLLGYVKNIVNFDNTSTGFIILTNNDLQILKLEKINSFEV